MCTLFAASIKTYLHENPPREAGKKRKKHYVKAPAHLYEFHMATEMYPVTLHTY